MGTDPSSRRGANKRRKRPGGRARELESSTVREPQIETLHRARRLLTFAHDQDPADGRGCRRGNDWRGADRARACARRARSIFQGRSVLITGGSRGLGLLLARELGRQGARITLAARDSGRARAARADLKPAASTSTPSCATRQPRRCRAARSGESSRAGPHRRADQQRRRDPGRPARSHAGGGFRRGDGHPLLGAAAHDAGGDSGDARSRAAAAS